MSTLFLVQTPLKWSDHRLTSVNVLPTDLVHKRSHFFQIMKIFSKNRKGSFIYLFVCLFIGQRHFWK